MRVVVKVASAAILSPTKMTAAIAIAASAYNRRESGFISGQPVFLRSTITTFAARNSAISDRKKMRSRRSITPAEIAVKWVRKLNEEMAFTSASGAQARKKSSTSGAPEIVKRKHTTTLTTNAITWFLVEAEMHAPMAR